MSAHHANLTSVEDYDYCYDEDTDESANAYQAHNDPVDLGTDNGEEAPDYDDDEENDICFLVCRSGRCYCFRGSRIGRDCSSR